MAFFLLWSLSPIYVVAQKTVDQYISASKDAFNNTQYQESLGLALKALNLAEQTKNPIDLANANLQVGVAYYYNYQNKHEILKYFFNARELIYKHHLDSLKPRINHNIGSIYVERSVLDSAEYFFKEVLDLLKNTNKYVELSKTNAVIAELYFVKKGE